MKGNYLKYLRDLIILNGNIPAFTDFLFINLPEVISLRTER